jgi:hypothetical protein
MDTSVLSHPTSVRFSFIAPKEVQALSVCQITHPRTFDLLQNPFPNGLYDPRLGPNDTRQGPCVTCGADALSCPGHLGHVNLNVPGKTSAPASRGLPGDVCTRRADERLGGRSVQPDAVHALDQLAAIQVLRLPLPAAVGA